MPRPLPLLASLFLIFTACDSGSNNPDAGEDATADANGDPGVDAGDTQADPGADRAADGDAGPGDTDPGPCPGPETYIGDNWTGVLEVTPGQCFLAASIEGRPLEEMYRTQAIMRIPAGTYSVPIEVGNYPLRLPTCIQRFDPTDIFTLGDAGEVTVQRYGDYVELSLWQYVYDELGQEWRMRVAMSGEGTAVHVDMGYIIGTDYSYYMGDNAYPYYERWRHTVVFEGGELTSDFFAAWGGTPSSGLLVRASGTLDGVAFDQTDYWKLVNNHDHHFFGADWAVLFDSPIGPACGLRIDNGNPIGAMIMYDLTVHTIDCDLQYIEERPETDQNAVTFDLPASPCPDFLP